MRPVETASNSSPAMVRRRLLVASTAIITAFCMAVLLTLFTGPARAQSSDPLDELLQKLRDKGVLAEDEYQALRKACARVYWQQIDLNALDPNLIDSDFFEGRTNLQGIFLAAAYCPTDAIITTVRFGQAHRLNANGPTPGSNPDIPNVQPLTSYKILQFDLTWKF